MTAKPGRPKRDKETERREAEEMFATWRSSDEVTGETEAVAIEAGLRLVTPHHREDHFSVDPMEPQPVRRGRVVPCPYGNCNHDPHIVYDEETEMTEAEKAALRHANRRPASDEGGDGE